MTSPLDAGFHLVTPSCVVHGVVDVELAGWGDEARVLDHGLEGFNVLSSTTTIALSLFLADHTGTTLHRQPCCTPAAQRVWRRRRSPAHWAIGRTEALVEILGVEHCHRDCPKTAASGFRAVIDVQVG